MAVRSTQGQNRAVPSTQGGVTLILVVGVKVSKACTRLIFSDGLYEIYAYKWTPHDNISYY